MRHLLIASLFCMLLISGCIPDWMEKEEEVDPCHKLEDTLEGTYEITITEYPLQIATEGWKADVLVFARLARCHQPEDTAAIDRILFNGLFNGFGSVSCTGHLLLNENGFEITYEDNIEWAGGPIWGVGTIIDGVFHFEGQVRNSSGDYPIILDGFKATQDRRTDAC